jgi:hypothetical protein
MHAQLTYPLDIRDITPDIEFYTEVIALYLEAEKYLLSFIWCKKIEGCFLYTNIGRVFCIFNFEIENSASSEDNFLWVIVGDIPPMYLDVFGANTTVEVVKLYIELAEDWINQIKKGLSVEECYPFNAQPTVELAELLEKKISFMRKTVVHSIEDVHI